MNKIDSLLGPMFPSFAQSVASSQGNSMPLLPTAMEQAFKGFRQFQEVRQTTGTAGAGLKPQDATPPPQNDAAREAAQAKIRDIMGNYDPEDGDADEKAQRIAGDPELCKYLTKEQRAELVKGLFDGSTGEAEEDAAMEIIRTAGPEDLKWVVNSVGWDELSDELDGGDLTEINTLLAKPVTSQSDYVLNMVGLTNADLDPKDGLEWLEFEHPRIQEKLDSMARGRSAASVAGLGSATKKALLKEIGDEQRSGVSFQR